MLQSRQHADLTNEPHFAAFGSLLGVQDFERDLTLVAGVVGEVNGGECSLSDLTPDFVSAGERGPEWSNRVARGERIRHVVSFPCPWNGLGITSRQLHDGTAILNGARQT